MMVTLEDVRNMKVQWVKPKPMEEWTSHLDFFGYLSYTAFQEFKKENKEKKKKKKEMLMIRQSHPKDSLPQKLTIKFKYENTPTQKSIEKPVFADQRTCLKRRFECKSQEEKAVKANKKQKTNMESTGPYPPPNMPLEFENIITAKGGSKIALVIQKRLYATDVDKTQGRLSMPLNKIISDEFLTNKEKSCLEFHDGKNCEGIFCDFIEPSSDESRIVLKKWEMKKVSGKKSSSSYVLMTFWNDIVSRNNLDVDMVVQVWAFRVNSKLCFALVHVPC